jgi:hypothetical protein
MSAIIFLRRLWKILRLITSLRPPNHHVNYCSVPRPIPRPQADIDQPDQNVRADAIKQCFGASVGERATMRGGREVSTLYSRRQLLANAAIAASLVES